MHYYFDDIHQIVDLAMREHVTALVAGLRAAADGVPEPAGKLRAVVDAYLATFAARPNAAFLWFEYWIDTSRRQAADTVAATLADVRALLVELLAQLPVDDPAGTAGTLLSWLLGTVVQQQVWPRSPAHLHRELDSVIGHRP